MDSFLFHVLKGARVKNYSFNGNRKFSICKEEQMEDFKLKQALLNEESRLLTKLETIEPGSEKYNEVMAEVDKVSKIILSIEKSENDSKKIEMELDRDVNNRSVETIKLQRESENMRLDRKSERRDKIIKYGLEGLAITLPLVLYASCFQQGLDFENEGTFTSNMFRNLTSQLSRLIK